MIGWTQAEPEWDDLTRMRHLALAEHAAGIHDGCGLHDSIAQTDPHFKLEDSYCPVEAALDVAMRTRAAEENEDEKDLKPGAKRSADGRTTRIRLLSPAEIAKLPKG